jgi:6-phosphogluconolactonase
VDKYVLYVGTYTSRGSKGIYAYSFDTVSGQLTPLGLQTEAMNPSFLVISPDREFLYAVSEISNYEDQESGSLRAYRIANKTQSLTLLNERASLGTGPCYLSMDKTGKYLLTANYHSGSIAIFSILPDGHLGEASAFVQHHGSGIDPERQEGPHTHAINVTPDNRHVLVADLGLDKLFVYNFDSTHGTIVESASPFAVMPPGSGPRHVAFHPNGLFVYVINELASRITMFSYDSGSGTLSSGQTISTLADDFVGYSNAAELQVDAEGQFLYASNRGPDTIRTFAVDSANGMLTPVSDVPSGGKTPHSVAIDPTGKFLLAANADSDTIVIFRIDTETGQLAPSVEMIDVRAPVCLVFR